MTRARALFDRPAVQLAVDPADGVPVRAAVVVRHRIRSSGSRSRCRTGATCSSMRASISRRPGSGWRAAIPGTSRSPGNYFAAPPPTLLAFAPFTLLPADTAVALIALAVIGGAIATIRLLHLPWWWLLFPPLVQCVLSGNVQSLIVPLDPGAGRRARGDPQDLRGPPTRDPGPLAFAGRGGGDHAGDHARSCRGRPTSTSSRSSPSDWRTSRSSRCRWASSCSSRRSSC